jgi:general stress protein 26
MFGGQIEIIEDMDIKRALWQDGWEMYYPKGVTDPDNSVLRLRPQFLRGWASLTHLELQLF